jgi:diguanylate cyclase (GGDEF)-like protein
MSQSTSKAKTTEVVPLAQRQLYLQSFRGVLLLAVGLIVAFGREALVADPLAIGAATGGYVGLALASHATGWLSDRVAVRAFGLMLIVDGVYLAWTSYATGGAASPLRYLIVVHLIAVALLASYRTGLKLALWHSLLLIVVFHAQEAGLLKAVEAEGIGIGTPFQRVLEFSAFFWVVAIGTAAASAVNERELRRRRYDLEALAAMATRLEHATDPTDVADTIVDATCETFDFRRAVLLAGREGEQLAPVAARGTAPADSVAIEPHPRSVLATVGADQRSRLVSALDPEADAWLDAALPGALNVVVAPLIAEGGVVGILVAEHGGKMGARIQRRVVSMVERFVSHGALALYNAWLLDHVRRLAATDGLTGAANRATFDEAMRRELSRAERHGEDLALLLIDIDYFKRVNDTHGHQMGDAVLKRISALLRDAARESDTVARYGGEEFAVILPHATADVAVAAAERLRAIIEADDDDPPVTVSIGVSAFPTHGRDADSLIAEADAALYRSKKDGRNRVTKAGDVLGLGVANPSAV